MLSKISSPLPYPSPSFSVVSVESIANKPEPTGTDSSVSLFDTFTKLRAYETLPGPSKPKSPKSSTSSVTSANNIEKSALEELAVKLSTGSACCPSVSSTARTILFSLALFTSSGLICESGVSLAGVSKDWTESPPSSP